MVRCAADNLHVFVLVPHSSDQRQSFDLVTFVMSEQRYRKAKHQFKRDCPNDERLLCRHINQK
jgi:hypothetical protein